MAIVIAKSQKIGALRAKGGSTSQHRRSRSGNRDGPRHRHRHINRHTRTHVHTHTKKRKARFRMEPLDIVAIAQNVV